MKLSDFHYDLPKELIAQKPLDRRDSSRLMIVDRASGCINEKSFSDIVPYLQPGDCLVLNNTRVLPARLYGRRKTGGRVEIFLVDFSDQPFKALINPSRRIKNGESIELENGAVVRVLGPADVGRFVEFDRALEEAVEGGHVPLPPYIDRPADLSDQERYQTVYAERDGATAAPTAGLHFTKELMDKVRDKGVEIVYVTLHTSYGTFAPVKADVIEDHHMHSEYFEIDEVSAGVLNKAKASGNKVFSVGTTSTRVLETAADKDGNIEPSKGMTDLFVYPGYEFKIVDKMITNFHLPESTLLMLVSAFAGRDLILEAYRKAVSDRFRFFSYGDAMMII